MKKLIYLIVNGILLVLVFPIGIHAQKQDESILKRYVTVDPLFHANIWSAVHDLAYQGIPIGFEAGEHWNVEMGPRLSLKSGRLVDVLNSISQQDSSYTWKEVDGVINFFPVTGRNLKSASFLDTRIGRVAVAKGDDRASTVARISKLFNGGIGKEIQFFSVIGAGNHLGLPDKFEEQLDIAASDMRTVLNKLTKVQKYSPLWSVTLSKDGQSLVVVF